MRDEKKLNVKIPAGVNEGDRVRLTGEGEAAPHGGVSGDLFVEVHLKPHAIFERQENNLYCESAYWLSHGGFRGGKMKCPLCKAK